MFETIVIGNDLSSLIAAVTSMQRGRKTILLREGHIPDCYSHGEYTFNIDPFPWTGFGPRGVSRLLLSKIDPSIIERISMSPLEPSFQVLLPEHRLDFTGNFKGQILELQREFHVDSEKIRKFYDTVDRSSKFISNLIGGKPYIYPRTMQEYFKFVGDLPAVLWHKTEMMQKYKTIRAYPVLGKIIDAERLVLSNLFSHSVNPFPFSYALSRVCDQFYYIVGGKHTLLEGLNETFVDRGGNVIRGCSILRLNLKDKVNVDIMMDDETYTITGKNIIVSTKWEKFAQCLFVDKKFEKLSRRHKVLKRYAYPFTLHMGILDRGIPEKLAGYALLISDEQKSLTDGNLILLEASLPGDTSRAPSGKRAVSATVFLKDSPLRLDTATLKEVSREILKKIESFFPFVGENLDFIDIDTSINMSRSSLEVLDQKYALSKTLMYGISPLPFRTDEKNMFLTGGMLLAGFGFEGEIISGINAANIMCGDR